VIAPLWYYLLLSAVIFTIGVLGVVIRKNPLVMFMSIELMLNAGGLVFAAFTRYFNVVNGQVIVFFILTIAAAEVVVGLAIIVAIYRSRASIDIDEINTLKG
jgi:NADH-quinone oxidoreductase subunit K